MIIKHDEDKVIPIDSHRLMVVAGEESERLQLSQLIVANVKLYALRNGTSLTTKAVAKYIRSELATALRKSSYHINLLIAGYDDGVGPSLYYLDFLATIHMMNVAGFGYGANFVLSMIDKLWKPDLTQHDALLVMRKGIDELKQRLVTAP